MAALSTPPKPGRRDRRAASLRRRLLSAALIGACCGAPLFAQGLQTGIGDDAWILQIRGEAALLRSTEHSVELQLGAGVEYDALAAQGDTWMLAGSRSTVTGRSELFVLAGERNQLQELAPPARAPGSGHRNTAVLLTAPPAGEGLFLDGIAWLEGSTRRDQAVWFAAWETTGFGAPQQIAPPAAGSQVALRGALIDDGSVLLVWSGFDGEDDEIWWSHRLEGEWTAPARVAADNRVPDITPALVGRGSEAQLVWSWYDGGNYRLLGSTFLDGQWSPPRPLAEPGSLYPELHAAEQTTYLVFLRALPRSWEFRQLAADLEIVAAASAPSSQLHHPAVLAASSEGLELAWQSRPATGPSQSQRLVWGPIPTLSPAEIQREIPQREIPQP